MSGALAALSMSCIAAGAFFALVGCFGLVRMPDLYPRMHAASVTDTLGAGLLIIGLMIASGVNLVSAKLLLIGDADQLQAIGAGGPFRSISERIGQCVLTQIRRQREEWRRETVEQFSRGESREALAAYFAKGRSGVSWSASWKKPAL